MKEKIKSLLIELNESTQLIDSDLKEYVDKIYARAKIINYMQNDELIGFIAFYDNDKSKKEAYLTMLAVNPKFQGQGYGKILLLNSIDFLRNNNWGAYKLEVSRNNRSVIELYKNNGFELSGLSENKQYMIKKM